MRAYMLLKKRHDLVKLELTNCLEMCLACFSQQALELLDIVEGLLCGCLLYTSDAADE